MAILTVPVGEAKPGETAPRRKTEYKNAPLDRPADSKATTIPEFLEECVKRNGSRRALGWRNLVEIHRETKKVTKIVHGEEKQVDKEWLYYENSPYQFITYQEMQRVVKELGNGLVALGLKQGQEKLHIFASTSQKWLQTFLATQYHGITTVTAYDTLGESGLIHSLVQTESNCIYTDNALLPNLVKPLSKAKTVRYIIHSEEIDSNDKRFDGKLYQDAKNAKEEILNTRPDIKFISYDELIKLGKGNQIEPHPIKPEDTACIMYTSGSTGDPKGVVLSHENVIASIAGVSANAGRDLVKNTDRIIAFLPLAHIFELVFEFMSLWWGGCLGYANVKTLTDVSCRNCNSDLAEFKPTIMVGVAAVWESVRKGVLGKVKQLSPLVQKIFWTSFKAKTFMSNYNVPGSSMFDVIFKKIRQATGGELRVVLNGGSPISRDAQVFITNLICPMLIGYGLTESTANAAILEHNHFEYGVAGTLTGSTTAKLIDVPEAGYYAKNNQGELLLFSKSITKEYYKNEKETTEAFTEDGWFKTGDIGEWTSQGALKIIDRRKNLVKTLNGEYIALEKLESIYRSNPIVLNVCAYADQSKVKPIAMVLPNEAHLKQFLTDEKVYSKSQLASMELATLCHDKKVVHACHKSLVNTGKSQGLRGIELIENVVLLDDEWTPQNGFVTSAQKLQRRKILAAYQKEVDAAYSN